VHGTSAAIDTKNAARIGATTPSCEALPVGAAGRRQRDSDAQPKPAKGDLQSTFRQ
jgi:hypothetical protein